jgi:hypothetical protein
VLHLSEGLRSWIPTTIRSRIISSWSASYPQCSAKLRELHWLTRLLAATVEFGVFVYNISAGHEVVIKFISDDVVLFLVFGGQLKRPENVVGLVAHTVDEGVDLRFFISGGQARRDSEAL